jgi:hypothetical protein
VLSLHLATRQTLEGLQSARNGKIGLHRPPKPAPTLELGLDGDPVKRLASGSSGPAPARPRRPTRGRAGPPDLETLEAALVAVVGDDAARRASPASPCEKSACPPGLGPRASRHPRIGRTSRPPTQAALQASMPDLTNGRCRFEPTADSIVHRIQPPMSAPRRRQVMSAIEVASTRSRRAVPAPGFRSKTCPCAAIRGCEGL